MSLGPPGASLSTEQAENFEDMEKQFAVKAVQHMSTYWAILEKMKGSALRLTKMDDEIYEHLKKDFPDFDPRETINENSMKSKEGKEKWRNFMMTYEKKIDDYNFGTMLRSNPKFEYGEKETIFGLLGLAHIQSMSAKSLNLAMRMQFYAIEIARNREGLNDWIYEREHLKGNKAET